jgi:protein-S-isoprenylcysteine O-methyltransferase Ste14
MPHPQDPPPMPRAKAIAYAIILPLSVLALIFLPAGSLSWRPGWLFVIILFAAFGASALILARVNPIIYRARSRFQPGTKAWDKRLLMIILPAMVAILPVAALDAGRFHWSSVPCWAVATGYAATLAAIAVTGWAQAVNPYFEPGVRIQSERHQRVIDTGPYRYVRHPGYIAAILLFFGMALALGSLRGMVPAMIASAVLVVRTAWEDRLLRGELQGYEDYARRVRWRLAPGFW